MQRTLLKGRFSFVLVGLLVSLFTLCFASMPNVEARRQATSRPPTTVIRTSHKKQVLQQAKKRGIEVVSVLSLPRNQALVTVKGGHTGTKAQSLAAATHTKALPNYSYHSTVIPNDTEWSDQWNLAKISAATAWDTTTGDSNTTIAVVDTGILSSQSWEGGGPFTQADFPSSKLWNNSGEIGTTESSDGCWTGTPADKTNNECDDDSNGFIDDWRGWDFMGGFRGPSASCPNYNNATTYNSGDDANYVTQDNDPQPYSCDSPIEPTALNKTHFDGSCDTFYSACYVGHGTMAASIASAASNNSQGIAGVNWQAKIMPVRALDGYGSGTSAQVVASIAYAVANHADVINLSLALFNEFGDCTPRDEAVEAALADAEAAGIVVVAAAGNTGQQGVCYPANSSHAISVGATDINDRKAVFSTFGSALDLVAPGDDVPAMNAPSNAQPASYYSRVSGTSFAAPHVAGAAALLKAVVPSVSANTIEVILKQNADQVSGMNGASRTDSYGNGRLNLYAAVTAPASGAYGNLRLITCTGKTYIVERGIARKRFVTPAGMTHWGFTGLVAHDNDDGCSYPTYASPLDRLVTSRTTNKRYFINQQKGRLLSDTVAKTWGIESSTVYPKLNDDNIQFLTIGSSLTVFRPNISTSNIRLAMCSDQPYVIERGIAKKRALTAMALNAWGLTNAYFAYESARCDYPSYSTSLDITFQSRSTNKTFAADLKKTYLISSQALASTWGFGTIASDTYPKLDSATILFLAQSGTIPRLAKSDSSQKVYLVDNGTRHYITNSEVANSAPLSLLRGNGATVKQATFSAALLQTLSADTTLTDSFIANGSRYMFDYGTLRQITSSHIAKWQLLLGDDPTVTGAAVSIAPSQNSLDNGWRQGSYYFRVTSEGQLERTVSLSTATSWGVQTAPIISLELSDWLVSQHGVTDI